MATIVSPWSGRYYHITDVDLNIYRPDNVQTRCGKTLASPSTGSIGKPLCPKCGSAEDFQAARNDMKRSADEREALRKEKERQDLHRQSLEVKARKEAIDELVQILRDAGAQVVVTDLPRTKRLEFAFNGFVFEAITKSA